MQPLDQQQQLFMVESDQLYRAWLEALNHARSYRYGMRWVSSKGRQYLLRLRDARGNGKSLGPRKLLDNMRARLSSHSMFADDKARARLMMCGDCRVVDLYSEEKPLDIREQR